MGRGNLAAGGLGTLIVVFGDLAEIDIENGLFDGKFERRTG